MHEPKNGDFVAYVEALQRESAARLARSHANIHEPSAEAEANFRGDTPAHPTPPPRKANDPVARRDRDAKLVRAIVPAVIGAALLLSWLGNGGVFAFVFGAALLAYAIPRLVSALRSRDAPAPNKAIIERVFGPSGTTGTRK